MSRCISDIKFSPDGTVLALGSHDSTIYVYNVADFGCKAKCRGHRVRSRVAVVTCMSCYIVMR